MLLDGVRVWPLPDSPFPPSVIRTAEDGGGEGTGEEAGDALRVAFGSCRWAAPAAGEKDPVGADALDTLAARIAADPTAERPDVLLLLGDQVYADEVSDATRDWLAARRDLSEPPGAEVADYEEYTHLYYESWLDPEVRWLLSTVPSCMIFDDHDVIDDWNTSASWLADMRETSWWRERLLSGLMSYWVHQHLGNLAPAELATDPLYAAVRESRRRYGRRPRLRRPGGRRPGLRPLELPARLRPRTPADGGQQGGPRPRRGRARDARPGRGGLAAGTGADRSRLVRPSPDRHLAPLAAAAPRARRRGWDEALCAGERGARWARFGEKLRRGADLEHWAAFTASFSALADLIAEVGSGPEAPATVLVLSGDVHHAYAAEATWAEGPVRTPASSN